MLVKFKDGTERDIENLSEANLTRADLSGVNLSGANLSGALVSIGNVVRTIA